MEPSFLLVISLLLALATPCRACECKLQHPQIYYCTSDFVILADLLGPGNNTVLKRAFRVNITKILKAPNGMPRTNSIYTPLLWEKCGYEMRTRFQSQLLIAGYLRSGRLNFTRCHLVYFWHAMTTEQKIGFEGAYSRGCKCQIPPCILCWRTCPEPDFTECPWKQRNCEYYLWREYHSSHAMCVPSKSGRCEWIKGQGYRNYQARAPTAFSMTTLTALH